MARPDVLLHLNRCDSNTALSWPEHERRRMLGLRRLRDILDSQEDAETSHPKSTDGTPTASTAKSV